MNVLFSDEKLFYIDGIYNSQNDRVWAMSRSEADKNGAVKQQRQFPQRVMVWFPVCSKGVSPMLISKEGTINHDRYIRKVLPVALKYGNQTLGSHRTFQQDATRPQIRHLMQQWCEKIFPSFINKDQWPPSNPDLNPLDYAILDVLAQEINWDRVSLENTLISQLKQDVEKIHQKVVFESCCSWTDRLCRMSKNNGDYLR